MRKWVYNLKFRSRCPSFTIAGYQFHRVDDYAEKVVRLQHLVNSHSEFKFLVNTGEHIITAHVDTPQTEEKAVLEWGDDSESTALSDILLLLSIFTGRDVFVMNTPPRKGH
jgi:hypothetical protein